MTSRRSHPELRSVLPGPVATLARTSARARGLLLRAALSLEGGAMRSATARAILHACNGVRIGAYAYGECFVPGAFPPGTTIGRYASIAEGVRALGRNHPLDRVAMHPYFFNSACGLVEEDTVPFGGLDVGPDAWLGLRAVLAPGCRRVGLGAVVAAGAVATHDVPDFAVVAGVPARIVRHRFPDDVCDAIRRSRWWEEPPDRCLRRLDEMNAALGARVSGHPVLAGSPSRETSTCA